MANAGDGMQNGSLRRHQHRERQLDKFFVLIDGVQGAADVIGDVGRTALLHPVLKLQDCGFQGELVFIDLEQQGMEQV